MRHKIARVIKGEYVEIEKDEGPAQPSTQQQRSSEYQSELLPIKMGRTMTSYDLSMINSGGIKLA